MHPAFDYEHDAQTLYRYRGPCCLSWSRIVWSQYLVCTHINAVTITTEGHFFPQTSVKLTVGI